jgi:hypothetical protein
LKTRHLIKTRQVWIEIIMFGTAVAVALALLIATLGAAAGVAAGETSRGTPTGAQAFEGMITCSHCGARHQAALNRSASNCVRVCIHTGSSFALIDDEFIYLLDGDLMSLKRLAGQRARITGTRTGKTIKVVAVTSAS